MDPAQVVADDFWRTSVGAGQRVLVPRAPLDYPRSVSRSVGVGPLQRLAPTFVPIGFLLLNVKRAPPQLARCLERGLAASRHVSPRKRDEFAAGTVCVYLGHVAALRCQIANSCQFT